MTDPDGGFYSAEDADSIPPEQAGQSGAHKTEGAFYLWRRDELDPLLGADAAIVASRFGIEPNGNAPSDPQQEFTERTCCTCRNRSKTSPHGRAGRWTRYPRPSTGRAWRCSSTG